MEVVREQINAKLQKIMRITQETEYYKQYFSSHVAKKDTYTISDFPFLTQQDVQKAGGCILRGKYYRYPDINNLLLKHSFGLLGIPNTIYWDEQDDFQSQAVLRKYRKEQFGIDVDEKGCIFCMAHYAGNKIMEKMPKTISQDGRIMSFSVQDLTQEMIKGYLETINKFNPVWLRLSPSIALMLIESMKKNQKSIPSSLRYIELYGEMLDTHTENMIKNYFDVQIGNVYSTKAAGAVAASCKFGHLHILEENAVVEIIRNGKSVMDEEGDVCITSLQNTAMPILRLKTGDKGMLLSEPCSCGRASLVFQLNRGRMPHFIVTESGRKISVSILRSMAEYANEDISRCLSYIHFSQIGNTRMNVSLGVKPAFSGWEKEVARIFTEKIHDSELKKMHWNFSYSETGKEMSIYDHLFFEPSGRRSDDAQ